MTDGSARTTGQRYFLTDPAGYAKVEEALGAADRVAGRPPTEMHVAAANQRVTVWVVGDPEVEARLRQLMIDLGVLIEEGPNQQVITGFENIFD